MASRRLAAAALCAAVLACCASCGEDSRAAASPTTVTFPDVGLQVRVPASLADLTYAMGESEEGQPTLYFSSKQLVSAGGASCAAGAKAAVSPYPLGQVVVTDETPEHVREETRENPEEGPGRFLKQVGDGYLYYAAPPAESCANDTAGVHLQRRLTAELRSALETMSASP
jgi:hypothetical protein